MNPIRCILSFLLTGILGMAATAADPGEQPGSGGINAPQHLDKPYLVLVSLDGFRWDYPDRYELPALRRILDGGFRVERLLPVFPSITFPNHYSIATGLYPDRHGLIANVFLARDLGLKYSMYDRATVEDGRFYAGEPIWATAEAQGMVAAAFFFVGTEAAVSGLRPSYWKSYSKGVPGDQRVDQVLAWLAEPAERRPHLLTVYFEHVDDQSHRFGVGSPQALEAMRKVDAWLGRLLDGIERLPHGDRVNVLVVSDHGQANIDPERMPLVLEEVVELDGIEVFNKGPLVFLYFDRPDPERIGQVQDVLRRAWPNGRVLTPRESPPAWRVGANPRWPDLMLVADPGYAVVKTMDDFTRLDPGAHGWAPELDEMHGTLLGAGPDFTAGGRLDSARSVDVYPLAAAVLGLRAASGIDGEAQALSRVLNPDRQAFLHETMPSGEPAAQTGAGH